MSFSASHKAFGYRFANRIWLERLFGVKPLTAHIRIAIFALSPLLIGFTISPFFGFASSFRANWAVYYGVVGIYLTSAIIWHGSNRQFHIYDRFLTCFNLSEDERHEILMGALERHSDTKRQLKSAAKILGVALIVAAIGFWPDRFVQIFGHPAFFEAFRFADFRDAGWYRHDYRPVALSLTAIFAGAASIPLGTAYPVMWRMPWIILKCARKGSILLPRLIKFHFSPLAGFYTWVSFFWSIGVILFALLFRHNSNWFFWLALATLSFVGIINFLLPQIAYVHVTLGAEEYWLAKAEAEFRARLIITGDNNGDGRADTTEKNVLDVNTYYLAHDRWAYPIHETYLVGAAQLLSLLFGLHTLKVI